MADTPYFDCNGTETLSPSESSVKLVDDTPNSTKWGSELQKKELFGESCSITTDTTFEGTSCSSFSISSEKEIFINGADHVNANPALAEVYKKFKLTSISEKIGTIKEDTSAIAKNTVVIKEGISALNEKADKNNATSTRIEEDIGTFKGSVEGKLDTQQKSLEAIKDVLDVKKQKACQEKVTKQRAMIKHQKEIIAQHELNEKQLKRDLARLSDDGLDKKTSI